jgi:hypothetical protein
MTDKAAAGVANRLGFARCNGQKSPVRYVFRHWKLVWACSATRSSAGSSPGAPCRTSARDCRTPPRSCSPTGSRIRSSPSACCPRPGHGAGAVRGVRPVLPVPVIRVVGIYLTSRPVGLLLNSWPASLNPIRQIIQAIPTFGSIPAYTSSPGVSGGRDPVTGAVQVVSQPGRWDFGGLACISGRGDARTHLPADR